LGQPLHVFDADKISRNIAVRYQRDDEDLSLLKTTIQIKGAKEAGLYRHIKEGTQIVIADDDKPIALAGIKGGEDSALKPDTKISSLNLHILTQFSFVGRHSILEYAPTHHHVSSRSFRLN